MDSDYVPGGEMVAGESIRNRDTRQLGAAGMSRFEQALTGVLQYSKTRDYAGYSKFDAMNSPFLEKISARSSILRMLVTQLLNRVPLPLRPIFAVKKARNPKGIANFIRALSIGYILAPAKEIKSEIISLCEWLLEHQANKIAGLGRQFSGPCWGYNFPWQSPAFYAKRFYPNAIVTTFAAEAFLSAGLALSDKKYLTVARESVKYLLQDLPILEESADKKCIGYVDLDPRFKVININSVLAGFLAKLSAVFEDSALLKESRRLLNWVADTKTDYHAWYYTHPPTSYVRDHDNYHTGGILDGFFDYLGIDFDARFLKIYLRGLEYYEQELFTPAGAPKWRNSKHYPYDIHGSAQGIISFAKAATLNPSYLERAITVADWALNNLSARDGGFYYQKHRFFVWRLELMRWNNSWMALALSELLLAAKKHETR